MEISSSRPRDEVEQRERAVVIVVEHDLNALISPTLTRNYIRFPRSGPPRTILSPRAQVAHFPFRASLSYRYTAFHSRQSLLAFVY